MIDCDGAQLALQARKIENLVQLPVINGQKFFRALCVVLATRYIGWIVKQPKALTVWLGLATKELEGRDTRKEEILIVRANHEVAIAEDQFVRTSHMRLPRVGVAALSPRTVAGFFAPTVSGASWSRKKV